MPSGQSDPAFSADEIERVRSLHLAKKQRACLISLLLLLAPLASCRRRDFPQYPADYREYAYVTSGGSNTVTVLDLVNLRQDRVIRVGDNPTGLAANPVKNEIYAVNTNSSSVSVIDAQKNAVVATIPVHSKPYFIDLDARGERGYVANSGSNNVSVIDLTRRREIALIGAGEGPGMARISPDGKSLVVTNRTSGSVTVVDPQTYKVRSVFTGCPAATYAVILPDSSKAFVACSGGHQVMVVGLARTDSPIAIEHADRLLTFLDVGQTPVHLALKPDGGEIFVSNFDSDTISEIATQANEVGGAYLVGAHPASAVVSADNSTLWISKFNTGSIEVYSIDDGKTINTVHVGDGPDALAFSAEGHLLLVADARSNDVAVVRVMSRTPGGINRVGTLFTLLPAGKQPNDIVVKAFHVR
ncbi:beta-propeller fold lactonase family protein [Alloacidobacterium dinghuense]|uniref:Beta-propeller fold lactonase family protein n=2 Tax=Alloacidobacterium dinghuense TaxID=2763107 RepID=A0A7G8BQF2_9BACT|nr:beta-propeller fold lactonase family protein [Alloacidobacterium dinghuense]